MQKLKIFPKIKYIKQKLLVVLCTAEKLWVLSLVTAELFPALGGSRSAWPRHGAAALGLCDPQDLWDAHTPVGAAGYVSLARWVPPPRAPRDTDF